MRVLLETHPALADHHAGAGHPELPERLDAVLAGIDGLDPGDDLVTVEARSARRDELITVHGPRPACMGAFVGLDHCSEPPTSGGPGMDVVDAVADQRSS